MALYQLDSYTITKTTSSIGGYAIDYDGNKGCWVKSSELNGFVPKPGMKIAVGLINNTVKNITINGRKIR